MIKYRYFYKLPNAGTAIFRVQDTGYTEFCDVIRPEFAGIWRDTLFDNYQLSHLVLKHSEYMCEISKKEMKNIIDIWSHPGWSALWGNKPPKNTTPLFIVGM